MDQNRGYSQKVMLSTSEPQNKGKQSHPKESIYFSEENLDDFMVIKVDIGHNSRVEKMIIDGGSSADIL